MAANGLILDLDFWKILFFRKPLFNLSLSMVRIICRDLASGPNPFALQGYQSSTRLNLTRKISIHSCMLLSQKFKLVVAVCGCLCLKTSLPLVAMSSPKLLTDPFLQLPTQDSVRVVWFTEFAGARHLVQFGANLEHSVIATTTKLTKMREDQHSRVGNQIKDGQVYQKPQTRDVWRHEAVVSNLSTLSSPASTRIPYRVTSVCLSGDKVSSDRFTLAPLPPQGSALKILLTSDHQLKPMTPANLQKVVETVGQVDAVFFAGDLVNIPDRASEWFDDNRGNAFFPSLQGRANFTMANEGDQAQYNGGAIIQNAPVFPTIGNHEVMGRYSLDSPLGEQYGDAIPRRIAKDFYVQATSKLIPPKHSTVDPTRLKNHSFNTDTYEEIFTLPPASPGGETYYAVTFGDVRLISLYVTRIWRTSSMDAKAMGRYRERAEDLNDPRQWGYGQHIFEPITVGSPQYEWLRSELNGPEFQKAKYKIVMFHHPPHSLGDNIVPAYTDPVPQIEDSEEGQVRSVRYEYPQAADYLMRDVVPLLESAGVQLVFYGHSHLWNRFQSPSGMHFLESSNVGNTYGAYTATNGKHRPIPAGFKEVYKAVGNPNGLKPIAPNLNPLLNHLGQPQPYIASNEITVFSIFDTRTGSISSYRFDTKKPYSQAVKFDEFHL